MRYKNFEDLPIWLLAREIVNQVYEMINKNEDLSKDFRLTGQMIGAGLSIMNNIAEGFDSDNNNEFSRYLKYSQRSCSEVMSMTYILKDVYKIADDSKLLYEKCLDERKQIKGFIKYLKSANT